MENKSSADCQKILASISPEIMKKEKERFINESEMEIKFYADAELIQQLEQLKGLLSKKFGGKPKYKEIFKTISKIAIEKLDPRYKKKRNSSKGSKKKISAEKKSQIEKVVGEKNGAHTVAVQAMENGSAHAAAVRPSENGSAHAAAVQVSGEISSHQRPNSRHIPAAIKRQVREAAGGRCMHVANGRRCNSTYFLEYEHVIPFASGGSSKDPKNITLLCWGHNQLNAVEYFGEEMIREMVSKKVKKADISKRSE